MLLLGLFSQLIPWAVTLITDAFFLLIGGLDGSAL